MLQARNIYKSFGKTEVLKGIDVSVKKGEVLSIIGPSGSGKSTLLRCLTGLERIDKGDISIDGEFMVKTDDNGKAAYADDATVKRLRKRLSFVFQSFNLFPHLNVMQNLTLAPTIVLGKSRAEAEGEARDLLARVGLSAKEAAYPCELSGGQCQRVAIARALAMNPEILCFDEPTSALDPELTGEVLKVIKSLVDGNMTLLIVTHEMGFASELSNEVIFVDDGMILERGTPDHIFRNSDEPRIKAFLAKLLSV